MTRKINEILDGMSQIDFDMIASRDPAFFGRRVLGLIIKPFHEEWLKTYMNNNLVCIVAPTGFGKSQIMAILLPIWMCMYNKNKEVLIVSNTMSQSTTILGRIKDTILSNEMLQCLVPEKREKKWSQTEIHLRTGCKIYCKPNTEDVSSYHANLEICDEIAKYRDHNVFFNYTMTRVNAKKGKLIAITTFDNELDLAHKLIGKEGILRGFVSKIYKAINEKGESIFPEIFSLERLNNFKKGMGSLAFEKQYLSSTLSVEDALFPSELVVKCFNEQIGFQMKEGEFTFMGCDFALGRGTTADYSVFVVVENVGRLTLIRRIERYKGMPITFQKERIRELYNIFKCRRIYFDSSSMGESFVQELRQESLPITPCDFSYKNRNDYLINLLRYIDEGRLVIPRKFEDVKCITMGDILRKELASFMVTETPSGMVAYKSTGRHDDIVMALALAIKSASSQKKFIDTFFAE